MFNTSMLLRFAEQVVKQASPTASDELPATGGDQYDKAQSAHEGEEEAHYRGLETPGHHDYDAGLLEKDTEQKEASNMFIAAALALGGVNVKSAAHLASMLP